MGEGRLRRVGAGLVGLGLASGAIALAVAAFRGDEPSRPSEAPVPGPTSSPQLWSGQVPEPILDVDYADVYRSSDDYVLGQACCPIPDPTWVAGLLMDAADLHLRSQPQITLEAPRGTTTTIIHQPDMRSNAEQLREEVFTMARVQEGTPEHDLDIEVEIGKDFVEQHRLEIQAASLVNAFLEQRGKGEGAESYLSEAAAQSYERGDDGLSLYDYATLPTLDFQQMGLTTNQGLVEMPLVPIWGETAYMDDIGPLVEILQVGVVRDPEADGGRRLAIVGVHRDSFPFPEDA
jgi:hypothetical protein